VRKVSQVKHLNEPYPDIRAIITENGQILPARSISGSNWALSSEDKQIFLNQMQRNGTSLSKYTRGQIFRGVVTGLNSAFIIDADMRSSLMLRNPKAMEIIKPLLVGDNVRKWRINHQSKYLIYMHHGIKTNGLGEVLKHLEPLRNQLESRATEQKWFELQQPQMRYIPFFDKPKILFPDIAKESRFAFDPEGFYVINTTYFIPMSDFYLLGVLNSSAIWAYAKEKLTALGDPSKGGRLRFFSQFVQDIPIPQPNESDRREISALVEQCLDAKGQGANVAQWEAEIDERVARLYGLSSADLKAIRAEQGKA